MVAVGALLRKYQETLLQMGNGDYTYIYTISVGVIGASLRKSEKACVAYALTYLLTKKDQSVTDRHTEYKIKTPKEKLHNIADGTCGRERQPGKKSLQVDSFLSHGWIQYV